jgi:hypothetical protein
MQETDSQKLDKIIQLLSPLQLSIGRLEGELTNLRKAIEKEKTYASPSPEQNKST